LIAKLKPGIKEELTFPAPAAGEYMFICTYPGHWQQMQGTFTVK
jgi:azurin